MSETPTGAGPRVPGPQRYEIRVAGHLAPRWAAVFDGMTLTPQDDGSTLIAGPAADQAALHGLLGQLRDLGLPLVSVTSTGPAPATPARPTRRSTT